MSEIEFSRDTLLKGSVALWQPARGHGYRYNLDPVLLSGFAPVTDTVMDLGSGCGVLGLLMLARGSGHLIAVEREPVMADLIRKNAAENGWTDRVTILEGDLRELDLPTVDYVVANPPYFKAGSGKPSPNRIKDASRFERYGTLDDFVSGSLKALTAKGRASFVMRDERKNDLLKSIEQQGAKPLRECNVHAHHEAPPRLLLMEFGEAEPSKECEFSRLNIHKQSGQRDYTDEVDTLLQPIAVKRG